MDADESRTRSTSGNLSDIASSGLLIEVHPLAAVTVQPKAEGMSDTTESNDYDR